MGKNEDEEAVIVLEGEGITELGIEMPHQNVRYRVLYDGRSCDIIGNCHVTYQSHGALDVLLDVRSRHTLTITPAHRGISNY